MARYINSEGLLGHPTQKTEHVQLLFPEAEENKEWVLEEEHHEYQI